VEQVLSAVVGAMNSLYIVERMNLSEIVLLLNELRILLS
jgi:hypothetical protein